MDLLLILLSAAIGTLVGVGAAMLLTNRKSHPSPAEVHLAVVKDELQKAQAALAASNQNVDDLRAQVGARDHDIQRGQEAAGRMQQQLDAAVAESKKAAELHATADQRVQSLITQAAAAEQRIHELESRLSSDNRPLTDEEASKRLAELDRQLSEEKERSRALAEKLTAQKESAPLDAREDRAELDSQLAAAKDRVQALTEEVARQKQSTEETAQKMAALEGELSAAKARELGLTEELARQKQSSEEAARKISALETELAAAKDREDGLTGELARQKQSREETAQKMAALQTEFAIAKESARGLTEELARQKQSANETAQKLSALETQIAAEKDGSRGLTDELARQMQLGDDAARKITVLESQLGSEKENARALAAEFGAFKQAAEEATRGHVQTIDELTLCVTGMRGEIAALESKLVDQQRSAVKGLELLALAKDQLFGAVQAANGHNGNGKPASSADAEPAAQTAEHHELAAVNGR